jgi:hypothetical protein
MQMLHSELKRSKERENQLIGENQQLQLSINNVGKVRNGR